MGVYNIIKLDKGCPNCGAIVEWQSKDLVIDKIYPVERVLETFSLNKRMSGEVHTLCVKCKTWTEAEIRKGKLRNFKLTKPKD
ncbi:hypothetical protein A2715_01185 [Candidatus Woesebacteria bacterium RIFCSPHIGHO2_01_FULL_39_32]|uniref:Uncharacterized protein n=1 Tax=Candidatus Woesebacteria bacterium RIFCSPLOWO2_01_FULL_39_25 TaxID=1802521 RepID=A0A1F8BIE1_9BACT|nr:MAG: hypothetical protein A2124_05255 [Candidatus Woesebacteria bacterium GWB1_37_5]OGM24521.1 MAG: hypothetical protein A2715_01185 [Candidatus Woesebacteria bacterium RIFCSPHIGHO2_01_FULL_39_32]OGM38852.1 MAG: hypothetical protein A3F01_03680 [Candidatus Woesebacteria bacterium RIFCSPHIGHO2_12_FULL_38_11]OGM63827.1 MAG: hypothetical protein A2893_02520 [Candidatus Woesebacteria bacterium RIFCSPLOWO2_01_FULL_39_25]